MNESIQKEVEKLKNAKIVKGFFSSVIVKKTKLSLQEVEEALLQMVNEGLLSIQYELFCPSCFHTVAKGTNKEEVLTEEECSVCGEEIDMHESHMQIRFLTK